MLRKGPWTSGFMEIAIVWRVYRRTNIHKWEYNLYTWLFLTWWTMVCMEHWWTVVQYGIYGIIVCKHQEMFGHWTTNDGRGRPTTCWEEGYQGRNSVGNSKKTTEQDNIKKNTHKQMVCSWLRFLLPFHGLFTSDFCHQDDQLPRLPSSHHSAIRITLVKQQCE